MSLLCLIVGGPKLEISRQFGSASDPFWPEAGSPIDIAELKQGGNEECLKCSYRVSRRVPQPAQRFRRSMPIAYELSGWPRRLVSPHCVAFCRISCFVYVPVA